MPPPKQPPVIATAPSTFAGPMPVTVGFGKPFQELFGVGKTKQASLINRDILKSFMVDGRRMILVRSYSDYVLEQLAAEAARREAGEPAKMKGHATGGPIPPKPKTEIVDRRAGKTQALLAGPPRYRDRYD